MSKHGNALMLASMAFMKANRAVWHAQNKARESCWTKKATTTRLEAAFAIFNAIDSDEKGDYEGVVYNAKIAKILAFRARSCAEQDIYNAVQASKGGGK